MECQSTCRLRALILLKTWRYISHLLTYYNASDLRVNERSPVVDATPFSHVAFHPVNALAPHIALPTRCLSRSRFTGRMYVPGDREPVTSF